MPYAVRKRGDEYDVVNTDTGESKGKSKSRAAASKLLHANTKELEYSGAVWEHQISKDAAGYDPLGGTDKEACANCHWFDSPDGCLLVSGDVSPTGLSNLWRAVEEYTPTPIQVEVTNWGEKSIGKAEKIKQWLSNLFVERPSQDAPPVGFRPIYMTKEVNGQTRATLVFSNNFEDRHKQIIPEVVHTDYIEWANRTGLYPEFQVWHKGVKSRWGQADAIVRIDHFTVATGLVDPGHEELAESFANDPNTGVSNGYYALYTPNYKEFMMWYPFEISALPATEAANVWMNDDHILVDEGYIMKPEFKAILQAKGLNDEFITQMEADIIARGATVEAAGVASKEVAAPPAAPTVGAELATLFGTMLDAKLNPVIEQISKLEQGQKDLEGGIQKAVETELTAKIGTLPQGYKATESGTNIASPQDTVNGAPVGTMDQNWLGTELDKLLKSAGVQ